MRDGNIIDRTAAQAQFERFIRGEYPARVLLFQHAVACGKSTLLRHLCDKTEFDGDGAVPSFVDLEDHADPTLYSLIKAIGNGLEKAGQRLPTFDRLENAKAQRDLSMFSAPGGTVGVVDLRGATVSGGEAIGTQLNAKTINYSAAARVWPEDFTPRAEEQIIGAFLSDLRALETNAVIFLDSLDMKASSQTLVKEIRQRLLRQFFLESAKRPQRVFLCIGAQEFDSLAKYDAEILRGEFPGEWKEEHTREYIRRKKYDAHPDIDLIFPAVHTRIADGTFSFRKVDEVLHVYTKDTV